MRRCRIIEAGSEESRLLLAELDQYLAEPCRRCGHTFAEHPQQRAVACGVASCSCHCFWEQPAG